MIWLHVHKKEAPIPQCVNIDYGQNSAKQHQHFLKFYFRILFLMKMSKDIC